MCAELSHAAQEKPVEGVALCLGHPIAGFQVHGAVQIIAFSLRCEPRVYWLCGTFSSCRSLCFARAMAAEAAAPTTPVVAPAVDREAPFLAVAETAAAATPPPVEKKKRQRAPRIDIDASIAAAHAEMKRAAKLMTEARRDARNEKRKKQRLMKKAAGLNSEDLERIAVLKRCGLWDPASGTKLLVGQDAAVRTPEEPMPAAAAASADVSPSVSMTGTSPPGARNDEDAGSPAESADE
jgi:hypothetical protein